MSKTPSVGKEVATIGNAELIKQNVDNIEQQIDFVKQNQEEFSKMGVYPEEFEEFMKDIIVYIKTHNGELPQDLEQFGLGSVEILKQQIVQIKDAIQRGGFGGAKLVQDFNSLDLDHFDLDLDLLDLSENNDIDGVFGDNDFDNDDEETELLLVDDGVGAADYGSDSKQVLIVDDGVGTHRYDYMGSCRAEDQFDNHLDETYGFAVYDREYYDENATLRIDDPELFNEEFDVDVDEPREYGVNNDFAIDYSKLEKIATMHAEADEEALFEREYGYEVDEVEQVVGDYSYLTEKCDNRFTDDDFESWLMSVNEDMSGNDFDRAEEFYLLRERIREVLAPLPNYNENCVFSYRLMHESKDQSFLSIPIQLPPQLQEYLGTRSVTIGGLKDMVCTYIKEDSESEYNKYIKCEEPDIVSVVTLGVQEIYDSDYESDEDEDEKVGLVTMLSDSMGYLDEYLVAARNQALFERYPMMMNTGVLLDGFKGRESSMNLDELDEAIILVDKYVEEFESYIDDCDQAFDEIRRAADSLKDIICYSHWRRFPDEYDEDYPVIIPAVMNYMELLHALELPNEHVQCISTFHDFATAIKEPASGDYGDYFSPKYDPNLMRETIKSITYVMDFIGGLVGPKRKVSDAEYDRHIKKRRLDQKALDEIRAQQTCVGLIFNNNPQGNSFSRFVREIAQDYKTDLAFDPDAFEALQYAAEDYLITLFANAQKEALRDNGRHIIEPEVLYHTHSLTHSLNHLLTCSLTHSLTYSLLLKDMQMVEKVKGEPFNADTFGTCYQTIIKNQK